MIRSALAFLVAALLATLPALAQPSLPPDVVPRVMGLRPPAPEPDVRPRVVREGLFAHHPPVLEAVSPDARWLAGTSAGALYLREAGGDAPALTLPPDGALRWDVEGAKWSPDAARIVVRRIDDADVPAIPLVDWETGEVRQTPYSRAGEAQPAHRLWIVDRARGDASPVPHAPDAEYVHALGWSDDGGRLRFLEADRLLKRLDLVELDVATGERRQLVREAFETGVLGLEMLHGYSDALDALGLATFFDERGQFAWSSERTGVRHLFLYDADGTLVRPLTAGLLDGPVDRVFVADRENGRLYFSAAHQGATPRQRQLYRLDLAGGLQQIADGPAILDVSMQPSGELLVHRAGLPRRLQLERIRPNGVRAAVEWEADWSFLDGVELRAERLSLPAADGETMLDALLVLPPGDGGGPYPMVEFLYAGPHTAYVPNHPRTPWLWEAYRMAEQGYAVVFIDARGTPGRGRAFAAAGHGRIGAFEIADHRAALEHLLAERPELDAGRVGVFGHSWGGYFALRAMIEAPDLYRAAVLAAPVGDLARFRVAIEPFMGCLPAGCPEAYAAGALLPRVGELAGPLLIAHGTADDDVPFGETMQLVGALDAAGKDYRLVALPGHDHIVQRSPAFWRHLAQFFGAHLRATPAGTP